MRLLLLRDNATLAVVATPPLATLHDQPNQLAGCTCGSRPIGLGHELCNDAIDLGLQQVAGAHAIGCKLGIVSMR